jgi:hypothetical protein
MGRSPVSDEIVMKLYDPGAGLVLSANAPKLKQMALEGCSVKERAADQT